MSTLSENIKSYRKSSKLTQKELAEQLHVAATAVSAWELGRNKPLMDNIEKMSQIFNIKKSELLGDTLNELSNSDSTPKTAQKPSDLRLVRLTDNYTKLDDKRRDRLVVTSDELVDEMAASVEEELFEYHVYEKLSAGIGTAYFEDRNYDTVYFDEEIDHDLASWVYGDSMEPDYLNGSVALIKGTGFDYDGAIYAVDWDGQSYIKKVYKEKDGLRLVSLNKKYADKFAPYDEDPRIIGKIVGNFMPMER